MNSIQFPALVRIVVLATAVCGIAACASMDGASQTVSLLEPANNAVVGTTFKVRFGVKGMNVAPAGDIVANSGHHHLLINQAPIAAGQAVPFSEQHLHFGMGQTEAQVQLRPGVYKLTAQFANGAHQSFGAAMSQTITVTVK